MFRVTLTAAVALALGGCALISASRPIELTPAQIAAVKDGVSRQLKDPYSVVWEKMVGGIDDKGIIDVCGTMNAKGGGGGYMGVFPYYGQLRGDEFKPTISNQDNATFIYAICDKLGLAVRR